MQSWPEAFGTTGAIPEEVALDHACLGAGDPDPILEPRTDLPHRVIVTLNVRSALHMKLFATSPGMEDSKGRGRSMHQEVRHHLGGK